MLRPVPSKLAHLHRFVRFWFNYTLVPRFLLRILFQQMSLVLDRNMIWDQTLIDIDQDFSSSGSLAHPAEIVLPTDTYILLQFFEFHVIEEIDYFMSFDTTDFKQKFGDLTNAPDTLLALPTVLIKKLLAVQSWYALQSQDCDGDPSPNLKCLTQESFNIWRGTLTIQRFETRPQFFSVASYPAAATSYSAQPSASIASTFRYSIKINISDYPKIKDETQWRAFDRQLRSTTASHGTIDVLTPSYVHSDNDVA
jgi:hypothetical protein